MIRSMTGFGEVQRETALGVVTVQVRTVNHRHFHTHYRLPPGAERWESELTQVLRERISRGSVHYRLSFQADGGEARTVAVDHARVGAYLRAFDELKARHGLSGEIDLRLVTRFGDIFEAALDEWERLPFDEVVGATRAALAMAVEVREREGEALAAALRGSLREISDALDAVVQRAPERLLEERDRLRAAVAELAAGAPVEEERLAREIAFLAERWDIREETVRLHSHLEQFIELLESDNSEPVGKRLGFWVQEMHREANTIGSKANDAEIAALTVDIKTAIEQMREQVENVE